MDVQVIDVAMGASAGPLMKNLMAAVKEQIMKSTELDRTGSKIQLPQGMSLAQAIDTLTFKKDEEEKEINVVELIDAFPFDVAHAMTLVMQEQFGFSGVEKTTLQGFFGPVDYAPHFFRIEVSRGKYVTVPWGNIVLPGIAGSFNMGFQRKDNRVIFKLEGKVLGKHKDQVALFTETIRQKLKTHSIYKGQAIKVGFRNSEDEEIFFDPHRAPEFIDLSGTVDPIFNKNIDDQIELSILNTIRFTERLRKHGIPIKRTVMLEGDFGTGKTLMANYTARECTKNGWTFLYVADCRDLSKALDLANIYSPAVVFAEDTDRIMSGTRNVSMDQLSYALDGVDNKGREILLIMTTNNLSDIQHLMLRPGRIDSVITFEAPNADTTVRLLKHYAKDMLQGDPGAFKKAIEPMVGQNAAFIAEVVNKAKLGAIARSEDHLVLTPDDIATAANLMKTHVDLMNDISEDDEDIEAVPMHQLMVQLSGHNGDSELVTAKSRS